MATAPATQTARQPLPLPTQSKREVADEITQGSPPKQARTTERATAASRPETAQEPPATKLRISQVTVTTKKGQKIEATSNEDEQEIQAEKILLEPWVTNTEGLDKEQTTEGMKQEIKSMKEQGVYTEVHISQLTPEQRKKIIKSRWVLRQKGNTVRARIVAKGYTEEINDNDDIFQDLCINTNVLRVEDATCPCTLQQLDLSHRRRHLNSLSSCSSSNGRSLYVSTNRVLQRLRPDRLETQQSHLWLTQQPKSMAKPPGRGDATTWTTTTCQRAQRICNTTRRRIHTMLCRRPALHRTTGDCQQAVQEHSATPSTPSNRRTHSRQRYQLSGQKHLQQR